MNLVVGATGFVGSEVCRQLSSEGKPVRALVRPTSDPAKVEKLKKLGVTLVQGDLKDRPSLSAACEGVWAVISTASSTISRQPGDTIQTVDWDGQMRLIDAAKAARVERFIFVSFRPDTQLEYLLQTAKRAVERHLKESGLTYTILQASYFMEIWLTPFVGFDFINARAQVYGSGQNKISWISLEDVARFAVASLENPAARNAVIELGGPEALSPLQVVGIFEELSGRQFAVQHVPEGALQAQKAGATDPLQQSFAALMLRYAKGDAIDMQATLRAFPIRLTTVRDYARRVLST